MIDANTNQPTAKIYQFPLGGRARLEGRRYGETAAAMELSAPSINKADCSGSWYHQAAIQDAKPSRDH